MGGMAWQVEVLPEMPTSRVRVLAQVLAAPLLSSFLLLDLRKQQMMPKFLVPCHTRERPTWSSRLLISVLCSGKTRLGEWVTASGTSAAKMAVL